MFSAAATTRFKGLLCLAGEPGHLPADRREQPRTSARASNARLETRSSRLLPIMPPMARRARLWRVPSSSWRRSPPASSRSSALARGSGAGLARVTSAPVAFRMQVAGRVASAKQPASPLAHHFCAGAWMAASGGPFALLCLPGGRSAVGTASTMATTTALASSSL